MNTVHLLKDVFTTFIYKKNKLVNTKSIAITFSLVLEIISTVLSFSALEVIRNLTMIGSPNSRIASTRDYMYYIFFATLFRSAQKIIFDYTSEKALADLSVKILREAMEMEYKDAVNTDTGEIIINIQTKLMVYKSLFDLFVFKLSSVIFFILLSLIKIINTGMPILYCFTVIYPILYFTTGVKKLRSVLLFHTSYLTEKIENSSVLYDKVQNFELIKSHGIEAKQSDEFYNITDMQRSMYFRMKLEGEKRDLLLSAISVLPFVTIILLAILVGADIIASLAIAFVIFKSLNSRLKETSDLISTVCIFLNSVTGLLIFSSRRKAETNTDFKENIKYNSVNVYHNDKKILENVNLVINRNDRIAVVGRNGTGKSTFIKTLLKFSSHDGNIYIDDTNINDLSNICISNLISYVSQQDYISDTTVLENIRMGNKLISLDEIINVAKKLNIHNDIMELPNGYETRAKAKGSNLSAGQKKKICILRAFIKNSPVMVLDEATSTVDKNYENCFVKNILRGLEERTVIMIIHQKELMKQFEKIIFLENGKVEDYGEFKAVYKRNEAFRKFMKET